MFFEQVLKEPSKQRLCIKTDTQISIKPKQNTISNITDLAALVALRDAQKTKKWETSVMATEVAISFRKVTSSKISKFFIIW